MFYLFTDYGTIIEKVNKWRPTMKRYNIKINFVIITILISSLLTLNSYAHSGKTDSNGGHRDKNNKSGLGSYHYHCGGHPAHLHPDGVCPYSSSSSASSNNSSNVKETISTSSTEEVTSIQINELIENIEVGTTEKLTATILPNNATNKKITWKSSDENLATINSVGELTATKAGVVDITASTSNGKSSTIKINIKEKAKSENTTIIKNSINNNISNLDISNTNKDDSNLLGGIICLGVLGGGYIGYKKYKGKSKG